MSERIPTTESAEEQLTRLAKESVPAGDLYEIFNESFVDFHKELQREVEEEFPEVPSPWLAVPAWHVLAGSTYKPEFTTEVSKEAKAFVEDRLRFFLEVFQG